MTSFDAAERQARINAGLPDAPVMDALLGDSDAAQPGAAMNQTRSNPRATTTRPPRTSATCSARC